MALNASFTWPHIINVTKKKKKRKKYPRAINFHNQNEFSG